MQSFAVSAFTVLLMAFSTLSHSMKVPFNQTQFDAARESGKPVAVVFHADWCPTCPAQAPVLKQLAESPELKSITLFVANFDTERTLRRSLGVTKQSTIVVFKDGKVAVRSTGDTQAAGLSTLLHHAIS